MNCVECPGRRRALAYNSTLLVAVVAMFIALLVTVDVAASGLMSLMI